MIDLKGKAAVVTGSARGIGKGIAEVLADQGVDVIISDINLEAAEETAKEIAAKGVKTKAVACNVTNQEEADALIDACVSEFGKIDILVNNAGITQDNLFLRMKKEQWDAVINVNLTGTFLVTHAAFKKMTKARSGSIINISSISGQRGNPGQANYAASKAGVIGFTKTIAFEGAARGVRCNAIAPGFIETEMTAAIPEKFRTAMIERIPLKRGGSVADIANGVCFLASDAASFITGHTLDINGGGFL